MPYLGATPDKGNFSDLNGGKLIIDADADTSITADTDDQIDIEISGADDFRFTANNFNVLSGSTLTIDSGATITNSGTASGFGSNVPSSANGQALGSASLEWSDLYLADGSVIYFGNDQDITMTHSADAGLILKNTNTPDDEGSFNLTLQTGETDMAANDILGKILFQAPDEATGTDAILTAAAIQARAEGDFSSSSNATSLDFMTGASEVAATKMTLSSAGALDVTGDITGSTINADGDTAAGDNAAIGYTASEGLILTGQGSTDDITIKNDADTTVVNVATGATDVEISAGNILFGTGSKGVYLGVTSATAANLLDDYEEGTFTPAYTFGGSTTGIVYGTNLQKGRYTKIGRFVECIIYIGMTDKGSQSGNVVITGLPFTSVNDGFNTSAVAHIGAFTGGWDLSAEAHFTGAVQNNSATLDLRENVFSTDTNAVAVTAAMATDDSQMYMSVMYQAA